MDKQFNIKMKYKDQLKSANQTITKMEKEFRSKKE